ncbi:tyrosine-type recombinase/integrase [Stenotrophomonas maltophilia]
MKRALTATVVSKAKAREKAYKLADGGGLHLFVSPTGSRSWRYKYRMHGKERCHTIGTYPELSLADARKGHEAARSLVKASVDPGERRRAVAQQEKAASANTFEAVCLDWILKRTSKGEAGKRWTPAYAKKVERMLARDVFPKVGAMRIGDVGAAELAPILESVAERTKVSMPHHKKVRVRTRGAATTAIHIRQICRAVFRHASARGLARFDFDPTWGLRDVVAKPAVRHNGFLHLDDIPALWSDLKGVSATTSVKIAIELLALTFVRTAELRNAEWQEFNLSDGKLGAHWRIPPHKMKGRREHLVPLSVRAIELLSMLKEVSGSSPFLFPSRNRVGAVMNANTVNQTLYRMGYAGKLSGHGFRATASTALHELGYPPHVIEAQLAHINGSNKTAASYNHATYWMERTEMMAHWSSLIRPRTETSPE